MEREKILVGFVEDGSYSIRESSSLEVLLKELDKARKANRILIGGPFFANNKYTAIIGIRKIVKYNSDVKEEPNETHKDSSIIKQTNIVDGDGKLKHMSFDCFIAPTIDTPTANHVSDKALKLLTDMLDENKTKTTFNKYCIEYVNISKASKLFNEDGENREAYKENKKETIFLLNMTYFCKESDFSILYKISKLTRIRKTDSFHFEFSECNTESIPTGSITFNYEDIDKLTKVSIGTDILEYFPIDFFGKSENLTDIEIINDFKFSLRRFLIEHKDDIKNKITADASLINSYKNIIFDMYYAGDSGAIPMNEQDVYLFNIHELNIDETNQATDKSKTHLYKFTNMEAETIFSKKCENKFIESLPYDYKTSDVIERITDDFMKWKITI